MVRQRGARPLLLTCLPAPGSNLFLAARYRSRVAACTSRWRAAEGRAARALWVRSRAACHPANHVLHPGDGPPVPAGMLRCSQYRSTAAVDLVYVDSFCVAVEGRWPLTGKWQDADRSPAFRTRKHARHASSARAAPPRWSRRTHTKHTTAIRGAHCTSSTRVALVWSLLPSTGSWPMCPGLQAFVIAVCYAAPQCAIERLEPVQDSTPAPVSMRVKGLGGGPNEATPIPACMHLRCCRGRARLLRGCHAVAA